MLKQKLQAILKSTRQQGQGMTEYIVIVALVAISAIAVYAMFGQDVRGQMASMSSQLAGYAGTTGQTDAKNARTGANTEGGAKYNLGNYPTNAKNAGQ